MRLISKRVHADVRAHACTGFASACFYQHFVGPEFALERRGVRGESPKREGAGLRRRQERCVGGKAGATCWRDVDR
eukprot:239638-Pleurochrysis_carterae.AAC.1